MGWLRPLARIGFLALVASASACALLSGASDLTFDLDDGADGGGPEGPDGAAPPGADGGRDGAPGDGFTLPDAELPFDAYLPPQCTTQGPRHATVATGGGSFPAPGWEGASEILATDGKTASCDVPITPLTAKEFGFTIPANATIKGIAVTVRRYAQGTVRDDAIRLSKGLLKVNSGAWPTPVLFPNPSPTTYGSFTDLWSTTWTVAEVNAPAFSVALTTSGSGTAHVDSITVTVAYCVETGGDL